MNPFGGDAPDIRGRPRLASGGGDLDAGPSAYVGFAQHAFGSFGERDIGQLDPLTSSVNPGACGCGAKLGRAIRQNSLQETPLVVEKSQTLGRKADIPVLLLIAP